MTSVFAFLVWCLTGNFIVHKKPHYRKGRVCKAGTIITVDGSSKERTSDLPGRWKHVTCFVIGRKDTRLADWIWRQRSRSLSWPVGWCLKSREAWTSALCRCVDEILSFFRDKTSELAIHNPHYQQQGRVCKGGTDITFYWEVGWTGACRSTNALQQRCLDQCALKITEECISCFWWKTVNTRARLVWLMLYSREVGTSALWRLLKNASLASDEKQWILELGWCDWCFTAEKSVPVRSEEIWRIHLMLLMKKH